MSAAYKKIRMYTFMRVGGLSLFEASDALRDCGRRFYGKVYHD